MKYVVVGNGIIGLTTANRLRQLLSPGDEIALIGPSDRTGSATLAAAAMLNSFAELEVGRPRTDVDRYHFELSRRATRLWPGFVDDLVASAPETVPNVPRPFLRKGTYVINNSVSDDLDDLHFDAIVQALRDYDEPFDLVDPKSIPNYQPAQTARALRALLIHDEGWMNPRSIVGYLDAILGHCPSVVVHDGTVDRLETANGTVTAAVLETGEVIGGDVFLLANGASFDGLLERSHLDLGTQRVFYGVGVSLEIEALASPHRNCIRTPNRGGACGIYTVPVHLGAGEVTERIVLGASNFVAPKPFYHGRLVSVAYLMERATLEVNADFFDAQLIRVNLGWRPTSLDTFPLLGVTSIGNLMVATGTKRDGFHLSPVISEVMAAMMTGAETEPELGMFAPERKPIRNLTRDQGIEACVTSLMSQRYQHGFVPSDVRMDRQLRLDFRADMEQLHDRVGATDWGIHPEMVNMYRRGHAR